MRRSYNEVISAINSRVAIRALELTYKEIEARGEKLSMEHIREATDDVVIWGLFRELLAHGIGSSADFVLENLAVIGWAVGRAEKRGREL